MKKATLAAAVLLCVCLTVTSVPFPDALAGSATVYTAQIGEASEPIAENLQYTTYRNIAIYGRFCATDTDGGEITYQIASDPKKGTVELGSGGEFVYTPKENKKGKDSFTYVAVDEMGNISKEARVDITISKQKTAVKYTDMYGSDAYYSALVLAENGIYVGKQVSGEFFFCPDEAVTRAVFLSMCMDAAGYEELEDITQTGFFDDAAMNSWTKNKVATALMCGSISGYKDEEGKIVFLPDKVITLSEAAVMLDNVLDITDSASAIATGDDWTSQAAANLISCGILSEQYNGSASDELTMAQAAMMIASAISVVQARK